MGSGMAERTQIRNVFGTIPIEQGQSDLKARIAADPIAKGKPVKVMGAFYIDEKERDRIEQAIAKYPSDPAEFLYLRSRYAALSNASMAPKAIEDCMYYMLYAAVKAGKFPLQGINGPLTEEDLLNAARSPFRRKEIFKAFQRTENKMFSDALAEINKLSNEAEKQRALDSLWKLAAAYYDELVQYLPQYAKHGVRTYRKGGDLTNRLTDWAAIDKSDQEGRKKFILDVLGSGELVQVDGFLGPQTILTWALLDRIQEKVPLRVEAPPPVVETELPIHKQTTPKKAEPINGVDMTSVDTRLVHASSNKPYTEEEVRELNSTHYISYIWLSYRTVDLSDGSKATMIVDPSIPKRGEETPKVYTAFNAFLGADGTVYLLDKEKFIQGIGRRGPSPPVAATGPDGNPVVLGKVKFEKGRVVLDEAAVRTPGIRDNCIQTNLTSDTLFRTAIFRGSAGSSTLSSQQNFSAFIYLVPKASVRARAPESDLKDVRIIRVDAPNLASQSEELSVFEKKLLFLEGDSRFNGANRILTAMANHTEVLQVTSTSEILASAQTSLIVKRDYLSGELTQIRKDYTALRDKAGKEDISADLAKLKVRADKIDGEILKLLDDTEKFLVSVSEARREQLSQLPLRPPEGTVQAQRRVMETRELERQEEERRLEAERRKAEENPSPQPVPKKKKGKDEPDLLDSLYEEVQPGS